MLTLDQGCMVSEMLDKMGLEELVEKIEIKLEKVKIKMEKQLEKIDKNDEIALKEFNEKLKKESNQVTMIVFTQTFATKIYKAKNILFELVADIKNVDVEIAKKTGIKEAVLLLKDAVLEELPDIISDKLSNIDLKKTF